MRRLTLFLTGTIFLLILGFGVNAQNFYTYAGTAGTGGYGGDGGNAPIAMLNQPAGIVCDAAGNIYFCDRGNNVVRKINTSGIINTIAGMAGPGAYAGDGGPATLANLRNPTGIALDRVGNIYITDNGNNVIRKVDTTGTINTIAGTTAGYSGDGGPAISAQLRGPVGIAVDTAGNIYFCDSRNNVVRMINVSGTISTIAGNNALGAGYSGDGGPAVNAQVSRPLGLTRASNGNLYIADSRNHVIRKVDMTSGNISTFAGNNIRGYAGDGGPATNASLHTPNNVYLTSSGILYIVDSSHTVRAVGTNDTITTVAGTGLPGYYGDGGAATLAKMTLPDGITIDAAHNIYVSCYGNNVIRRIGMPVAGINITSSIGDTICFGPNIHFFASPVADSTPHYQWLLNGVPMGSDSIEFTPASLAVGDTISCELLTSSGGTVIANSNRLRVDSLPRVGYLLCPPLVCIGNTINVRHMSGTGTGGGGGVWGLTNSTIATLTIGAPGPTTVTGNVPGNDTLYYIMTNICGSDSAKAAFAVNFNTLAPISGPTQICYGGTVTYSDTSAGGIYFVNPPFPGIGTMDSLTGVFTAGTTVPPFPVTITVSYGHPGCSVTDTIYMNNIGYIIGSDTLCSGESTSLTDIDTTFSASPGTWSISPTAIGVVDTTPGFIGAGNLVTNPGVGGTATITYAISSVCYTTFTITVNQLSAIVGPTSICTGDSVKYADSAIGGTWIANPTSFGNFLGSPGNFLPVTPGQTVISYSVGSCSAVDTINIGTGATVAAIVGSLTLDSSLTTTMTDATPGGVWKSSNPLVASIDSATGVVTGLAAGTVIISYYISPVGPCSTPALLTLKVKNATGVATLQNADNIVLFPNPAKDAVVISWKENHSANGLLVITDVAGKVVLTRSLDMNSSTGNTQADISGLANGVYFVCLTTGSESFHGKLNIIK